jgi:hypothetical protein
MSVPFFFREAVIADVDPANLTCTLSYGDLNSGELSHGVPMPNLAGSGNAGVIANLKQGTRVIAAYLHDTSKETVVIIAVLPSELQKLSDYNAGSQNLLDKNAGTLSYPKTLAGGDVYVSAHTGPKIWLKSNDSAYISSSNNNGIFLVPGPNISHNLFLLSNNHSMEGSGGRLSWGRVKRSQGNIGWSTIGNFNTDILRDGKLRDIGFWFGDRVSLIPNDVLKRNPALSEYKLIINEFATEFGMSGLDREIQKNINKYLALKKDPTKSRNMESTNSLALAEGELIEIIGGNLVDIGGHILDINYNPLYYSPSYPTVDSELKIEEAIRKSRRGIGYHFKLSTNHRSNDVTKSLKDFIFDIDKEGVLKVNIPKSSSTGNIPYITDVNFTSPSNERLYSVAPANPAINEKIPVHLKDRDGKIVDDTPRGTPRRQTGIRFANAANDAYFLGENNSGKKTIRVNTTRHHNIYAAAERLIANYVTEVHVPSVFSREKNLSIGPQDLGPIPDISSSLDQYSLRSSFEKKYKESKLGKNDPNNYTDVKNLFYSAVAISPAKPAISTGGDTFVAGQYFDADNSNQPLISNYFKAEEGESGININPDKTFKNVVTHGGVSANVNLEGSLELSLGEDSVDNKSLVLDTAGSLVMWLGKDKNNRSLIFQSDGDVLVNVGGSYDPNPNPEADPVFNPGRFDLRVNVVDKGFHDTNETRSKKQATTSDDNPYSSDYLISISDKGLVISGMKAGAPMVIRNDGDVMLESASGKLILKGNQVETVEIAKLPTDDGRSRA